VKRFRTHLAVAIDGGGIRGLMIARALAVVEEALGRPLAETGELFVGTSTGSIIAAALASGLRAERVHRLYGELGHTVFPRSVRTVAWPFFRWRYPGKPLEQALEAELGGRALASLWRGGTRRDLVVVVRDLVENRSRFLKPYKREYDGLPVWKAVMASSAVPTYFPVVDGRFVDGGVGAYSNPCFVAAWEAMRCLGWTERETTLLSFGSGRTPDRLAPGEAARLFPLQWLEPVLDSFLDGTNDQQVRIVRAQYPGLDFRRFQIDIPRIAMDDVSRMPELDELGARFGAMILDDAVDQLTARSGSRPRAP